MELYTIIWTTRDLYFPDGTVAGYVMVATSQPLSFVADD